MGYDGVGIGARDLGGGIELLKKAENLGLPLISVNLYDTDGRRLFAPYRVVERSGLNIGIIAVTGLNPGVDGFLIREAESELEAVLPDLETRSDMIVLLSSLPYKQTLTLVSRFEQIDIAVCADRSKGNLIPVHSGNALVLQTSSRGQYLGVLEATVRSGPWMMNKDNEAAKLKRQLQNITMQLNHVQTLPPEAQAGRGESLNKQSSQLREKIAEIEGGTVSDGQDHLSTYRSRYLPLSQSTRQDPRVQGIVNQFKKQIRATDRTP